MQTYRILYFREDVLEPAEDVTVSDTLEAIGNAPAKLTHLRAELWAGGECVGRIGTSPTL